MTWKGYVAAIALLFGVLLSVDTHYHPEPWPVDRFFDATVGGSAPWLGLELLSFPGHTWVALTVLGAGAAWLLYKRAPVARLGLWLGAGAFGLVSILALKALVARPRPSLLLDSYALPSGHTLKATLIIGMALLMLPKTRTWKHWAAWAGIALVTGIGRVLGGVHWMTDVWAGWWYGTGFLMLTLIMADWAVFGGPKPSPFAPAADFEAQR